MKKTILGISGILIATFSFGQKSVPAEEYLIIQPKIELDALYWTIPHDERKPIKVFLTAKDDTNKIIQNFNIVDLETYYESAIYTLTNPDLKNVKQVIKVELEYSACCSDIKSYYFLLTNAGKWTSLPVISNVHCDGPEPFHEYRFPIQKFGKSQNILRTESFPNSSYEVDSISIKEMITWNGKNIE